MTEKRFVDGGEECIEDQFLIDTSNDKYYWVSDGLDDIVKLLNELHEENQLLKLQSETKLYSRRELEKENEELKCGNKNLKATLNDFINICNRLQANPTDKQTVAVARDMLQNMEKELEE